MPSAVRRRRRSATVALAFAVVLALSGCTGAGDRWSLEAIGVGSPHPDDVVVGTTMVAADGEGGFWSADASSWVHVDAEGETVAEHSFDPGEPLFGVTAMAALSADRLVVVRGGTDDPTLSIVDTRDLTLTDVPIETVSGPDDVRLAFGAVAARAEIVHLVRYRLAETADLEAEVLRIHPVDGRTTVVHIEPLHFADSPESAPGLPPVALDVTADRIFLATPVHRIVLDADGAELARTGQDAERPHVAADPDGAALWWGAEEDPRGTRADVVAGSAEAREVIARHEHCQEPFFTDSPLFTESTADLRGQPLSFLCGVSAAGWVGDGWVVALGGENGGALVRVVRPAP
ncbi:hypothetical protein [Microbacterium sp. CIAB417]|uniref:hypothetical protein n=1 Tax=Microbacterium sp. CIAB417 TaxID=2860287 RepID=UPI001FABD092|nr:hypothetical protein [Microbacterium sp. CIAB417]